MPQEVIREDSSAVSCREFSPRQEASLFSADYRSPEIGVLPGESKRTACVEAGLRTKKLSGCCERQTQELQRAAALRMPQRALVHEPSLGSDRRGELAGRLQCPSAPQCSEQPNAPGVCTTDG